MNPRAFLLEDTAHDVTGATSYGTIQTLFTSNVKRPSIWTDAYSDAILARLREVQFDPDKDFIIISGPLIGLTILAAAISYEYGSFRGLAFNAHDDVRNYEVITLGYDYEEAPTHEVTCT